MKLLCYLLVIAFFATFLFTTPAYSESSKDEVTLTKEQLEDILKRIKALEKEVRRLKMVEKEYNMLKNQRLFDCPPSDESKQVVEPPRKFLGLFGTQTETVPSLDLSGSITVEFHYTNLEKEGRFIFEGIEINPRFNLFEELQVGADLEFSEPSPNEDDLYLEQAFISWAPFSETDFEITMGRFNSIIGIEDVDPDGALMATHSIFQDNLLPGDQTGVMVAYRTGSIRLFGAITNSFGFNDAGSLISRDNNDDNTLTGRFEFRPENDIVFGFNVVAGPERDDNNHDYRVTLDVDFQIAQEDFYYLGIEILYGWEENSELPDPNWFGIVGVANYSFSSALDATIRVEYISDSKGGSRLGTSSGTLDGFNVWSTAVALRFHPLTNMDITLEYRYDGGDEEYYSPKYNSKTFTVEVSIIF